MECITIFGKITALDVGQSGIKIHEACTVGAELSCGKTTAGDDGVSEHISYTPPRLPNLPSIPR